MKILWYSPSAMLCEWMIGSLNSLRKHDLTVHWFEKYGSPPDKAMLEAAEGEWDVILYTSVESGPFLPDESTFEALRKKAPLVHLCFDASDTGWNKRLAIYKSAGFFSTTINCDGCDIWDKGPNDVTLWCPVDSSPYTNVRPLKERSVHFGFCGGHRAPPRRDIVFSLVRNAGLVVRNREEVYGSYDKYVGFLQDCRIILNIAFSAGGYDGMQPMSKQLKARVLEVGFSGACLLETRNSAAATWFEAGKDFLQYETPGEAAFIVANAGLDYLQSCADNLRAKCLRDFSPEKFWNRVFERI